MFFGINKFPIILKSQIITTQSNDLYLLKAILVINQNILDESLFNLIDFIF